MITIVEPQSFVIEEHFTGSDMTFAPMSYTKSLPRKHVIDYFLLYKFQLQWSMKTVIA